MLPLLVFLSVLIGQSVGISCPTGCTCVQLTVRCVRLHLTAIPSVSPETTILDLRYNQIHLIPSNGFAGLTSLHTIFLSDNEIGFIHDNAFKGLSALKYLYLNNNRISKMGTNAFHGLSQLQNLYLDNNNIWEVDPKAFSNLPNLVRLFLSKNNISAIPDGSFVNLPSLKRLRLDNNPIECDCGVRSYLRQYKDSGSRYIVAFTCSSPSYLFRRPFSSLKEKDFHCEKPKLMEEPNDVIINPGEMIELPCDAVGDPKPEVFWMQNSNKININNSNMQIMNNGTLRILQADQRDVGIYECMAKNVLGEVKSRPVRMIIGDDSNRIINQNDNNYGPPNFIILPSDTTIGSGIDDNTITLHCVASGRPTPHIAWYFNERLLSQSTNQMQIHTNGTLIIENPTKLNAGLYRCVAKNFLNTISADAYVHANDLPKIILVPQSQTVKSGTTIVLECDAEGDPQPIISWKRNDTILHQYAPTRPIIGTGSPKGINRISFHNENTELQIEDIKESDSGRYVCIAENINGLTEAVAEVSVESTWGPPRLIFEPYDMDVLPGSTVEIPCKGEGDPAPQVKWQKDGRTIFKIDGKYLITLTGSLHIESITNDDAGRYECSISNVNGRATATALLTVKSNEVLTPGDRFVRVAFTEAAKEIDQAINHTIKSLFTNRSAEAPPNHGELFRLFRFPNAPARQLARAAEIYERTLVNIRKYIDAGSNLTAKSDDFKYKELLSPEHLHLVAELSGCMEHRRTPNCTDMCFHSKYRNIDGTCNNLNNPYWGASLTAFRRIKKPYYENGFSMPIGWTKGKLYNGFPKPSARLVSTSIISTKDITQDSHITHMVMQWGQFLDHDLDHAIPSVSSETWDGIDCKKTCEYAPPCYPIEVPPNDPRVRNRRCIDLVRSSAICGSGMTSVFFDSIQPREQINQLTSFIDASQVYGYSKEFAQELRNLTTDDGLLRTGVSFPNQKEMLPFAAPQDGIDCRRNVEESSINCFVAGDIRVNEQVGLLAMHVIWMREHNRIARKLKELNPHWDGDTLYEESRKIVGAQMQHFTYKHWLPIILGSEGMNMLGEYKGYNPSVHPSIANEFATAALRFGHSLINPILHRLNETYQPIPQGNLQLHKAFFSPWRLVYEGGVDPLMRGLFSVAAKLKLPNQNLNTELTEKLFHTAHAVSLDLAAINIQRSREHGIPGYNEYRKFCNMTVAQNFEDLSTEISSIEIRNKLKELYGHPSNIDIWVGGILEDQIDDGKVGPLFRCLLIEQFRRLRDGDRFYYENPSVFIPEQLQQIQQSNLGRVMCDNGDNITEATENIFILPERQAGYMKCSEIPGINLYFWQDCGICNSLPPILNSYLPNTYRNKRSVDLDVIYNNNETINNPNEIMHDDLIDINEERVSGLEDVISSFHKELKNIKRKLKKLEQNCNHIVNKKYQHYHCLDSNGNRRLNNEIWNEDECTKCQCKHPQVTCITERCAELICPTNIKLKKYPGECCSQCPSFDEASGTTEVSKIA